MKPITIIKTGKTFPDLIDKHGDFEDWISRGLGRSNREIKVVNAETDPLPEPTQIRGAIISGSHAYVTDNLELVPSGLKVGQRGLLNIRYHYLEYVLAIR